MIDEFAEHMLKIMETNLSSIMLLSKRLETLDNKLTSLEKIVLNTNERVWNLSSSPEGENN